MTCGWKMTENAGMLPAFSAIIIRNTGGYVKLCQHDGIPSKIAEMMAYMRM